MTRLADYVKDEAPGGIASLIEDSIDVPEPLTIGETIERMARTVVAPDEEDLDELWRRAEQSDAPSMGARAAFDQGARLNLPPPPTNHKVDPALKGRPSKSKKAAAAAGADQLTELFAAGMILLITFTIGEWALPTAEEASDLARPLANILARRVDLAAKLGKDANDTVAFVIAVMAYTVRVGPIAAERARDWNTARQRRGQRERTIPAPGRSADSRGEGIMADGSNGQPSTRSSAPHHPLDALATARATQRRSLDRDFGYTANGHPAMGG